MSANYECSKDSYLFAEKLIDETNTNTQMKEEMNKIKTELDEMPCDLPLKSQKGGGFTLTTEQKVTAAAWAGRLFAILQLGGYLYNIYDAYSIQCAAPHWVAGYFGLGDAGYCASKAAILQETTAQLTTLITAWIATETAKKAFTPSGGKRKSKRTRKSKKSRKSKKGRKGRKSRKSRRNK